MSCIVMLFVMSWSISSGKPQSTRYSFDDRTSSGTLYLATVVEIVGGTTLSCHIKVFRFLETFLLLPSKSQDAYYLNSKKGLEVRPELTNKTLLIAQILRRRDTVHGGRLRSTGTNNGIRIGVDRHAHMVSKLPRVETRTCQTAPRKHQVSEGYQERCKL